MICAGPSHGSLHLRVFLQIVAQCLQSEPHSLPLTLWRIWIFYFLFMILPFSPIIDLRYLIFPWPKKVGLVGLLKEICIGE